MGRSLFTSSILLSMVLLASPAFLAAMPDSLSVPDSTGSYETILFTGHLDFDCVPDTVIGYAKAPTFRILPRRIVWGQDTALDCGTLTFHEDVSWFAYPDWEELWGSVSILTYNTQDSISDILLTYGGKVDTGSARRDTATTIVLFGQDHIADRDSIPLGLTDTMQMSPFFAMKVIPASRLIDSSLTDYTGFPSYVLPLISLDVTDDTDDTATQSILLLTSVNDPERERSLMSEIYPNPISQTTTIRARPLPPGTYRVEAVSTGGEIVFSTKVDVGSSGELFAPLDLSGLSSGYYQILIRSGEHILTVHSVALIQ